MVHNMWGFFNSHCVLLYIGIIVALVGVLSLSYWQYYFSASVEKEILLQSMPDLTSSFVNREKEVNELLNRLQFTQSEPRIISITGSPGFGKSTLAIRVGHLLHLHETIDVNYIDMNEITGVHELAERVISVSNRTVSGKKYTLQDLYQWSKSLRKKTLLIMDNCDQLLHTSKDDLQQVTKKLMKYSNYQKLKILTTSRHQVLYLGEYHHLHIEELSSSHSCEILLNISGSTLDSVACNDIAYLTGGVPLALHVVGKLMNMLDSPKPHEIVGQLRKNLIGTLSPNELHAEDRVNVSIYLSYQYLDDDRQKMGRYFSYFPGSFDRDAAYGIVKYILPDEDMVHDSLRLFVRRSLLDYNARVDRYIYHRLIREFFKNMSNAEEIEAVKMNFISYYTALLDTMVQEDFSQAVLSFYREKHNFKYFVDQFNELSNKTSSKRACHTIMALANTLSKRKHILNYGLTSLELHSHIKNVLFLLNQSRWNIIQYFGKKIFVQEYSKLILLLLETESSLITNKLHLIQSTEEHKWIFEKHSDQISTPVFIKYYSTLASHYEKISKHKQAKAYFVKALRREMVLGDCHHKECSNLELAKAFSFVKDKVRSTYYSGKELDSIDYMSTNSFKAAEVLSDLYSIYESNDDNHGMNQVAFKLDDLIKYIVNSSQVVGHIDVIIKMISILQAHNHEEEVQVLKNLIKVEVESSMEYDFIFRTLRDLYYVDKNHEMVIVIGESFIKLIGDIDQDYYLLQYYLPNSLFFVGQSYFLLHKYEQSMTYFQKLVELPRSIDTINYIACCRLTFMHLRCVFSLPGLMWFNIKSIWTNTGNFLFSSSLNFPEDSSKSYNVYFNDFLSTDLASVPTALALHDGNMIKTTRKFTFFYQMLSYPLLSYLFVLFKVIILFIHLYTQYYLIKQGCLLFAAYLRFSRGIIFVHIISLPMIFIISCSILMLLVLIQLFMFIVVVDQQSIFVLPTLFLLLGAKFFKPRCFL